MELLPAPLDINPIKKIWLIIKRLENNIEAKISGNDKNYSK